MFECECGGRPAVFRKQPNPAALLHVSARPWVSLPVVSTIKPIIEHNSLDITVLTTKLSNWKIRKKQPPYHINLMVRIINSWASPKSARTKARGTSYQPNTPLCPVAASVDTHCQNCSRLYYALTFLSLSLFELSPFIPSLSIHSPRRIVIGVGFAALHRHRWWPSCTLS